VPLAVAAVPYAVVVGVLMRDAGMDTSAAMLFSVLVYAGASQIAALELMAAQAPLVIVLLTMLVVNARFMLYSAAMWALMADEPGHRRIVGSYVLTDQAFALTAGHREQRTGMLWPYYLGAASLMWVAWQVGTLAGALLGDVIPEWMPLGLALPLVMMALAANHARSRPAIVTALSAAVLAVVGEGPAGRHGPARGDRRGAGAGPGHRAPAAAERAPMIEPRWWVVFIVGALGTFALRASIWTLLPAARRMPRWLSQALSLLPAAALAALAAPALLAPEGPIDPVGPRAIAGLVALAVAIRTRNVLATLVTGFGVGILLEFAL
jgi:4-azaleucine resistance transporter AzlC